MTTRASCAVPLSLLLFTTSASASDTVDFAASLIGRPYVWGAEGPSAFDCSGLTQFVFREFGIELPRRAISQSKVGDPARGRLRRGDLVFFSSDTRRSLVTHVGIYEGAGMMIDASQRAGRVRRDDLDEEFWAERYMFARRVTDADVREDRLPVKRPQPSRRDRSKVAIQVLERLADVLLRQPGH